jgi:hypothetical protein
MIVTSDVKTAPSSFDLPTRSEHVVPLGVSRVKTPNPVDGLTKSNDAIESDDPAGAVVDGVVADHAGRGNKMAITTLNRTPNGTTS